MRRAWLCAIAIALATPVAAASLSVVKSSAVVSDPVNGSANPRAIPDAQVDYALVVTNPLANLGAPVRTVVIVDTIATQAAFRVADYGAAGGGPVQFDDGTVILLGASGLGYGYGGLSSPTDGLEFSDGSTWNYTPRDDGTGYDPRVRAIRVTLTGSQIAGGTFRLRYRVQLR